MKKITLPTIVFVALGLLAGCSSGGGSSGSQIAPDEAIDNTSTPPESGQSAQASNDSGIASLTDVGNLLPVVFPTQTELDLEYAQAGFDLIERLNNGLILPADIDVIFADCGTANAFYVPPGISIDDSSEDAPDDDDAFRQQPRSAGGSIIMCHELTQLFASFYSDKGQATSASIFVLMHELGHALVNQLSLPVLGIEESYVDGVAAVFVGEAGLSEGSVLAGWFFGNQSQTPFFDSHRAGPQRLGDLACWGVGSDPTLSADPIINNIAQQLMGGGRNCPAEYAQQLAGLTTVLEPHLLTSLQNIFGEQ